MLRIRSDRVEAEEIMSSAIKDPSTNLKAYSISGHRGVISLPICGATELFGVVKGGSRACRSVEMEPDAVRRYVCHLSLPPLKVLHFQDISIIIMTS